MTMFQKYCEYMGEMPSVHKNIPQPSLRERDRRWSAIREAMGVWGLDCLMVWGSDAQFSLCEVNFRYLTAIPSQGRSLVLFPYRGEPIAFVGTAHDTFERICYNWVRDVRTIPYTEDVVAAVKEIGCEKGRIGIVGNVQNYWPFIQQYPIFSDVQTELSAATFVEAAPLLSTIQLIKSEEEIELLQKAGQIARCVYDALISSARPGIKECELYAEMLRALVANGGEPNSMLLMDAGNPAFAHPKHPPVSTRKLEHGDMIVVEYHVKYAGMVTHTERTVCIGEPDDYIKDIYKVCKKAYRASLASMKPGATLKSAVQALRKPVNQAGLAYLECGYHSHGCTSGGFPSYNDRDEDVDNVENVMIRPNMVFTQEVDLFDPNHKHGGGVVLADSFVVTQNGATVLADIPTELAIV